MDHDHIEENQIIDRYLQGRLPEAEADQFVTHSLDCDQCLTQLEMAERLHGGLKQVFDEDAGLFTEPAGLESKAASSNKVPLLRQAWLGWAAALIFGALTLWLWVQANALDERLDDVQVAKQQTESTLVDLVAQLERAEQPVVNLPVLQLQPLRSSASPNRLPSYELYLDKSLSMVVFSLATVADVGPFEVTFLDGDDQVVWQSHGLEMDVHGQVVVGLPSSMLKPGDYRIHMFAKRDQGESFLLAIYDFRATEDAVP